MTTPQGRVNLKGILVSGSISQAYLHEKAPMRTATKVANSPIEACCLRFLGTA